jgi:hypothetical protein
VLYDESDFVARNLAIVRGIRELQEYLFSDGEVPSLLSGKVFFDELAVGTSKVVDGIGAVLTDMDLPVWVGDLVNNPHCSILFLLPFFDINLWVFRSKTQYTRVVLNMRVFAGSSHGLRNEMRMPDERPW